MKNIKNKIKLILALIMLTSLLCSCKNTTKENNNTGLTNPIDSISSELSDLLSSSDQQITDNAEENTTDDNSFIASKLEVHFIDIGQGDCTLITCDDQAMLIDAGDNDKGSTVATYLKSKGIKTLDIVIGTHNDSDHIGGLDVCLYQFDCKNVILSKFAKDNKTYDDVIQTCKNKNYKIQYPEQGTTYSLGDATVTILSNPNYKADSANNSSISILITHHENTFLFTGDSEENAEFELIKDNVLSKVDVLSVGHHGSKSSTTDEFLETVAPAYAVISCGEGNSYGHPHAQTLNKLRMENIKMFRTDAQGTIIATSDGSTIIWNMSECDVWTPGESSTNSTKEETPTTSISSDSVTYILNINSKKIHLESCNHVKNISEKNKEYSVENLNDLLNKGFSKCKTCNP